MTFSFAREMSEIFRDMLLLSLGDSGSLEISTASLFGSLLSGLSFEGSSIFGLLLRGL